MSAHAIAAIEPLYFGCHKTAGHYAWDRRLFLKATRSEFTEFLENHDGKLPPQEGPQTEGVARLHHHDLGFTVLAFWDRSIDKRGNSNSAFLLPGHLDFDHALDVARTYFPKIFERFAFAITKATA